MASSQYRDEYAPFHEAGQLQHDESVRPSRNQSASNNIELYANELSSMHSNQNSGLAVMAQDTDTPKRVHFLKSISKYMKKHESRSSKDREEYWKVKLVILTKDGL